MIALLLAWCGLGIATAIIGLGLLNLLNIQALHRLGDRLIVSIWLGILLLAWLLFSLSLGLPLSPGVGLGGVGMMMGAALMHRSCRQEVRAIGQQLWAVPLGFKLVMVALGVAIAALASQPIIWPDTGLYHYPATRWFAEYGTVPGLALVHHRFGTNSAWFALAAPLDVGGLAERQNTLLGGFLFWMETVHLAYTMRRLLKGEQTRLNWFVCLGLLLLMPTMIWGYLPFANSPDLPVLFVSFLIAWLILLIAPQPPQRQSREAAIPLLLAALTAAIKLSALPLIALVFFFYCWHHRSFSLLKRVGIGMGITMLSLLPLLSFNLITSGCFLYPVAASCTPVSWSVGAEFAQVQYQAIQEWNRWFKATPAEAQPGEWILPWIRFEGQFSFLIVCSLVALVLLLYRYRRLQLSGKFYVLLLGSLGLLYVFKSAPSWRFGLGYACVLPALFLAEACAHQGRSRLWSILVVAGAANFWLDVTSASFVLIMSLTGLILVFAYWNHRYINTSTFLLLLLLISSLTVARHYPTTYQHLGLNNRLYLWRPPKLSTIYPNDRLQQKTIKGVDYFFPPEGSILCWAAPLPCTPILTTETLELRDPQRGFRAGFQRSERE
ncbi:MAG: hypothetical protein AAGG51_05945 [Cyanobacteria bacterium P01_G01_bin.54]